ncbi:putative radical SAM superfamily Fe-S cluster-containing enzyme [Methanohalophilus levihalophilus]|uniref:tetraether lipid synthase Tes n=1 Tax=Methanohalophilus levihalophilus TaxID=1431282 RepID=UPI001AE8BB01|nr:putative radical SAM superfamily Fe-S cluster-containing enzyme [Methanohalophilus levihalophilus]
MEYTKSICPECLDVIEAKIFEENDMIMMEKTCPEHGDFREVYWSDAKLYQKFKKFEKMGDGISNPMTKTSQGCPKDCGICEKHKTTTLLANIDVTNRCNMSCPICFANAKTRGLIYEPTFEQIVDMLKMLRDEKPTRCFSVQFSGGEPTVRDDLPEIIRVAEEMGFVQIQIATNGIRIAKDLDYAKRMMKAGLRTVYLSFDGISEEIYRDMRGFNAFPMKVQAIKNCRAADIRSVDLVPTIARGINDHEIGDIIRFAADNRDVVKGVNFQPIAFTGRIDQESRNQKRFTIPDLIKSVEEQTEGQVPADAWYPVPFVVPVSRFLEKVQRRNLPEFTVHPHCGAATYAFVENGKLIPITDFIDVEGFMGILDDASEELNGKRPKDMLVLAKVLKMIPQVVDSEKGPKDINVTKLLVNVIKDGGKEVTRQFHRNAMFLGCMHFQDPYNFDAHRVESCGVHYATPDGRVIPFCTYNTLHRDAVESKFLRPYESKPTAIES